MRISSNNIIIVNIWCEFDRKISGYVAKKNYKWGFNVTQPKMCQEIPEKSVCKIDTIKHKKYILICSGVVSFVSHTIPIGQIEDKHGK